MSAPEAGGPHGPESLPDASARFRRMASIVALAGVVGFLASSSPPAARWAVTPGVALLVRGVRHAAILAVTVGGILTAHLWLLGQNARFQHLSQPVPPRIRVIAWAAIAFVIVISAFALYYSDSQPFVWRQ